MKNVKAYYDKKEYSFTSDAENIHQKIISLIGSGINILDVGCASGHLGRFLKEKGNTVYGVELSEKASHNAAAVLDGVIVGNIEEISLPWPANFFDVVICADVLEHLFAPERVMLRLKALLKDDGMLIASLPNIAYYGIRKALLLGRFEYCETGTLDRGHIRFFTFASAERMLQDVGFRIVSSDCTLYLPAFLGRPKIIHDFFHRLSKKYMRNLLGYQFLFVGQKDHSENERY